MAEYPLTRSREFANQHVDFHESLHRAGKEGHTLSDESVEHLKQTDRLDVGYWLSLPQNRAERDRIHNLSGKPQRQIAELDKIAARIDASLPFETQTPKPSGTDEYLQRRREDIRSGRRYR